MPEPEAPVAAATTPDSGTPAPEATSLLTAAPPPEAAAPEAQTDNKDAKAAAPAVPEKYEFKLPEGVKPNEADMVEFETLAREAKLSNEAAQKIIDYKVKLDQAALAAQDKQRQEWADATKTDKEIGGQHFAVSVKNAQAALARFAPPALLEELNRSGLGNHPEMVRFCANIGKAMGEASFTPAGSGAVDTRTPAKILYPNMN